MRVPARLLGGLVLLCTGTVNLAAAVPPVDDPVEALRRALERVPVPPGPALLQEWQKLLVARVDALQGLGQMRRAFSLDWYQGDRKEPRAVEARKAVVRLVVRFDTKARALLKTGSAESRAAVFAILADVRPFRRDPDKPECLAEAFAPDLLQLVKTNPDAGTREGAIRTLGRIGANPDVVVPALTQWLAGTQVGDRRAAAEAAHDLIVDILRVSVGPVGQQAVEMSRPQAVRRGRAVLPMIQQGLADADLGVRATSAATFQQTAVLFAWLTPGDNAAELAGNGQEKSVAGPVVAELRPLLDALKDAAPALVRLLNDPDQRVRVAAAEALEKLGDARSRLVRITTQVPWDAKGKGPAKPFGDSLRDSLRGAAAELGKHVADKDVEVRLAMLYALEGFEADAEPAAEPVMKALADADPFVRWGAARVLEKLAPRRPDIAASALGRALTDENADVRVTVAGALLRYGPAAKQAAPALAIAVGHKDPETRLAAIRALGAMGPDAQATAPALVKALGEPKAELRTAAAEALGRLGRPDTATAAALRKILDDPDPDVRMAAAEALLAGQ